MDIADAFAVFLKPLAPGWSADDVESVARSLGETVLWRGSGFLDGTVSEAMRHVGLSYATAALLFATTVLFLFLSKRGRRFARNVGVAAAFVLGVGAGLLVASGTAYLSIARDAAPAYLVTRTRLVVLTGRDSREDVPAADVEAVVAERGGVAVRLADGRTVRIPARGPGRAALEPAVREMAGTRA